MKFSFKWEFFANQELLLVKNKNFFELLQSSMLKLASVPVHWNESFGAFSWLRQDQRQKRIGYYYPSEDYGSEKSLRMHV